jgi:superfamily I DNA/RNA helicase
MLAGAPPQRETALARVLAPRGAYKQQIMRWAMAMEEPFVEYERDFAAQRTSLLNNYRSSPELVRIQHILAQALDEKALAPVSKVDGAISGHSCAVWDFSSPRVGASMLGALIAKEMTAQRLSPRDFVILVRQKAGDYVPLLADALADHNIVLRNEAAEIGPVKLQELLSEDLSELVISLIRLATAERAGRAWGDCLNALSLLRGLAADDDRARTRLGHEIEAFAAKFRKTYPHPVDSKSRAVAVVTEVLDFIGRADLAAACPAYRQGDWMKKVEEAVALHLRAISAEQPEWQQALDIYEGLDSLPLMTIHKSKGLEYHTVIFVGLDDGAWWSFSRDQVEATAGFFVAFTRAKQRVLFTYCPTRGHRNTIATLYELLQRAGVPVINVA